MTLNTSNKTDASGIFTNIATINKDGNHCVRLAHNFINKYERIRYIDTLTNSNKISETFDISGVETIIIKFLISTACSDSTFNLHLVFYDYNSERLIVPKQIENLQIYDDESDYSPYNHCSPIIMPNFGAKDVRVQLANDLSDNSYELLVMSFKEITPA